MRNMLLRGLVLSAVALTALPLAALADPCLVVYPDAFAIYHYEVAEYYTVGPGDPLYDAAYDRGGEVLIDVLTNEVAYDVYQATGLAGFQLDNDNQGYFTMEHDFDIVVDGFNNTPVTYTNILLVFDWVEPNGCIPVITVDGNPPAYSAAFDGWTYPVGDLTVTTPTPDGMNYSDTISLALSWNGCQTVRIWAFADENFDGLFDAGSECFSAFSHDLTVPSETSSWGKLKSLYTD